MDNIDIKEKVYTLSNNMSLKELELCMKENNFVLGFKETIETEYWGKPENLVHMIYFNKEGTLMIFNWIAGRLDYFGNSCIFMRHINNKKYFNYIKKHPYSAGSTCPIDGPETDITVFSNTNLYKFLYLNEAVNQYSTPCIPYYLSETLDGAYNLLILNPIESKEINKFAKTLSEKYSLKEFDVTIVVRDYLAFKKISKYHPDLQKLYINYISNFMDFLKEKTIVFGIKEDYYKKILKELKDFPIDK